MTPKQVVAKIGLRGEKAFRQLTQHRRYAIQRTFANASMIAPERYVDNLRLAERARGLDGSIIECGVWRGGMIAGIAKQLGPRQYVLFDSFQGIPPAKEIDGELAKNWQADTESPTYFNNATASIDEAKAAMSTAGVETPDIRVGWFDDTVPPYAESAGPIALLRLDGDLYESTMVCLEHLFPLVVVGGVVIIDDYGAWDGCTRAVHRYLADHDRTEPVMQTRSSVAFLQKRS